jgi:hypothetical protein
MVTVACPTCLLQGVRMGFQPARRRKTGVEERSMEERSMEERSMEAPLTALAAARARRVAAMEATGAAVEDTALYGVALLKIALELKRQKSASLDEVFASVLGRMRIDQTAFHAFLMRNGGLFRTIAQR